MKTFEQQRNVYQQVILEHAKKPRNQGVTQPIHCCYQGHNPYCGDRVEVSVKLSQTGKEIEEIKFQGEGCAIAIASTDIMAEVLKGKSLDEASRVIQDFCDLVKGEIGSIQERKLNVFQGLSRFPLRIKCATLGWHTLKSSLTQIKQ